MSNDSFSAKKFAYFFSSVSWSPHSKVCLMATNRIERDLTSIQPLLSALVLSSLPPYLSLALSQSIAHDVIALMSAAKPVVRQKAIMKPYNCCRKTLRVYVCTTVVKSPVVPKDISVSLGFLVYSSAKWLRQDLSRA